MLTFLLQRLKIPPTKPHRNLHRVSVALPKFTCKGKIEVVPIQFCTVRKYWVFISITYIVNKKICCCQLILQPHLSHTIKLQGCPHGFLFMCSYSQLNDIHMWKYYCEILSSFCSWFVCICMLFICIQISLNAITGMLSSWITCGLKSDQLLKCDVKKICTFCPLALFGG